MNSVQLTNNTVPVTTLQKLNNSIHTLVLGAPDIDDNVSQFIKTELYPLVGHSPSDLDNIMVEASYGRISTTDVKEYLEITGRRFHELGVIICDIIESDDIVDKVPNLTLVFVNEKIHALRKAMVLDLTNTLTDMGDVTSDASNGIGIVDDILTPVAALGVLALVVVEAPLVSVGALGLYGIVKIKDRINHGFW